MTKSLVISIIVVVLVTIIAIILFGKSPDKSPIIQDPNQSNNLSTTPIVPPKPPKPPITPPKVNLTPPVLSSDELLLNQALSNMDSSFCSQIVDSVLKSDCFSLVG